MSAGPARRRRAHARGGRAARGFSLLEVLLAFGLLAVGLALLLGALAGGVGQVRWSRDASEAALHARSLLDRLGRENRLRPGEDQGETEDGRYAWTLRVEPWLDPAAADAPLAPAATISATELLHVTLELRWGEGPRERLQVQTLRGLAPEVLPSAEAAE
jgi:general secretion pathway protein I